MTPPTAPSPSAVKPLIGDTHGPFVADVVVPVEVCRPMSEVCRALYPVINAAGLEVAYAHTLADAKRIAAALTAAEQATGAST